MTVALLAALILFGVGTGVAAGLLGVGGGILIVPFLTLALGLSQHAAEATSLVVVLPTAVVASLELRRRGIGDLGDGAAVRDGRRVRRRQAACCWRLLLPASTLKIVFAVLPRAGRPSPRARTGLRPGMTQTDGPALVDELASRGSSRVCSAVPFRRARGCDRSRSQRSSASPTPVREALRKLQANGLVEMLPRRGALVRGPSAREVREAYEVRAELEGLAASLAATCTSETTELEAAPDGAGALPPVGRLAAHVAPYGGSKTSRLRMTVEAHEEWIEGNELLPQASSRRLQGKQAPAGDTSPTSTAASRAT